MQKQEVEQEQDLLSGFALPGEEEGQAPFASHLMACS